MEVAVGRVTVVGSYIVALVMDTEELPVEGQTVKGSNFHTTHGGKGSNIAVCAARLGAESAFVGKIGRDSFGEGFLSLLETEGVNKSGVLYADQEPTAVGFIVFSSDGTNLIVIDPAANETFSPEDVLSQRELIASSDVVVSPLEIPLETALAAASLTWGNGKKAILNPAPAEDLREHDMSCVFALTPNETEGRVCLGLDAEQRIDDLELARSLLDLGAQHVILTLGAKGAIWACKEGVVAVPALEVEVVDTVGAGDALNAGLAVGLGEGWSLRESIAMGITAASLSTRKRETIDSYPFRYEVNGRIEEIIGQIERMEWS